MISSIPTIFKQIRDILGLTQKQFAKQTGINRQTYSAYEIGRLGKDEIKKRMHKKYLLATGIDLNLCMNKGRIIIVNDKILPKDQITQLITAGAEILLSQTDDVDSVQPSTEWIEVYNLTHPTTSYDSSPGQDDTPNA